MEGSDYKGKCSQRANDVRGMSNCEKRKVQEKKRIGVNRNITPLLSPRQRRGYLSELVGVVCGFIVKVVPHFIGHSIIDISQGQGMATASRQDMRGEVGFGSDHAGGALGVMRGSSA